MRSLCLLLVLAATLPARAAATPFAQRETLALRAATPNTNSIPRCGGLELTLDFAATFDNPFNPAEAEVWASFTSPDGKETRVNGFLDQPHTRRLVEGRERIEPAGDPVWRIRFTPQHEGRWRYRVFARDRSGTASLPESDFTVTASTHPGFIRRAARNPRGFSYDNGQPFFAVGENMGWGGQRGSFDYDDWLPALAKAGGNWIRIWMCSWNCALEWSREGRGEWRSGNYHGVGVYSLDNAWKLDTILDAAERHGIAVMLCLGTYGEFREGGYFGEGQWRANPYNVTNGGPCLKPEDFWTDDTARQLYRQRLRYLAARYGGRTGIHSWEFWNEQPAPAHWVAEMARFLKGTGEFAGQPGDPYGHLISTTYGDPEVWRIPEIDFTQSHHYGMGNESDHAPVIHRDARAHLSFGKPHLMAEFGIDWRTPDTKYDPAGRGINLHNGLWASALSGNAGGAMIWWWDNYVHPKHLYGHFTPLRKFTDAVPWADGEWKPLAIEAPRMREAMAAGQGIRLPARAGWGRAAVTEFRVTAEGVEREAELPQFLFGPAKAAERTAPVFRFEFDRPGRFVVKVDRVSDRATLRFVLNGQTAAEYALSARPPTDPAIPPEYVSTELSREWNIYQAKLDRDYGIEIPAGAHELRLEVTEGDWASMAHFKLTGFSAITRPPPLNLYGLLGPGQALLWAQNAAHHWKNVFEQQPIPPAPACVVTLRGLPDGPYAVEWWDTWSGEVVRRESAQASAGSLALELPAIETDVAVRLIAQP